MVPPSLRWWNLARIRTKVAILAASAADAAAQEWRRRLRCGVGDGGQRRQGDASVPGRAGIRRVTSLVVAVQCLLAILALAGCALPNVGLGVSADAVPRPTRTATVTPLPWKGAPHQLPGGWTAYYAPHFTIAVPPGWQVNPVLLQKDPNPKW